MTLLTVRELRKTYPVAGGLRRDRGEVRALDGVSFSVREGETFALVGESGCGKTTLARVLIRLVAPTAGTAVFAGRELSAIAGRAERKNFYRQVQMVFQDP